VTDRDTAHVIAALAALLLCAHAGGYLFARYRQPQVIGEILGGLVLGPTVLGRLWPAAHDWLFPGDGTTAAVISTVAQLGLLLLMFMAGTQMRGLLHRSAVRAVATVAVGGLLIPFALGLIAFGAFAPVRYEGTAHSRTALLLIFASAIAVTSIPVISRIMLDLGLLGTRFSRIVLSVAVIEDVVLYVVLAVAIGLVAPGGSAPFGLAGALDLRPGSTGSMAYHTVVTLGFLAVALLLGPRLYGAALHSRLNVVKRQSQIGFQLIVLLAAAGICLLLSIVPLFGAFVAGIVVATAQGERAASARQQIGSVAMGLFIPAYFASVGLSLDLIDHFELLPFVALLLFACAAKATSVYVSALVAGESRGSAANLAVAMNARGGPGIVLATTAYAAGIVDQRFYASLVMLSIVTSLIAGAWLERTMGRPADVPEALSAQT
jgi:Kef-type K+ transport system membrane component KefB